MDRLIPSFGNVVTKAGLEVNEFLNMHNGEPG